MLIDNSASRRLQLPRGSTCAACGPRRTGSSFDRSHPPSRRPDWPAGAPLWTVGRFRRAAHPNRATGCQSCSSAHTRLHYCSTAPGCVLPRARDAAAKRLCVEVIWKSHMTRRLECSPSRELDDGHTSPARSGATDAVVQPHDSRPHSPTSFRSWQGSPARDGAQQLSLSREWPSAPPGECPICQSSRRASLKAGHICCQPSDRERTKGYRLQPCHSEA